MYWDNIVFLFSDVGHAHVDNVQVIDEEHSGQNINGYFSKMAVQTMITIKPAESGKGWR